VPTDNQIYAVPANQFSPSPGTTLTLEGSCERIAGMEPPKPSQVLNSRGEDAQAQYMRRIEEEYDYALALGLALEDEQQRLGLHGADAAAAFGSEEACSASDWLLAQKLQEEEVRPFAPFVPLVLSLKRCSLRLRFWSVNC